MKMPSTPDHDIKEILNYIGRADLENVALRKCDYDCFPFAQYKLTMNYDELLDAYIKLCTENATWIEIVDEILHKRKID